jgi:hypothetical protein
MIGPPNTWNLVLVYVFGIEKSLVALYACCLSLKLSVFEAVCLWSCLSLKLSVFEAVCLWSWVCMYVNVCRSVLTQIHTHMYLCWQLVVGVWDREELSGLPSGDHLCTGMVSRSKRHVQWSVPILVLSMSICVCVCVYRCMHADYIYIYIYIYIYGSMCRGSLPFLSWVCAPVCLFVCVQMYESGLSIYIYIYIWIHVQR